MSKYRASYRPETTELLFAISSVSVHSAPFLLSGGRGRGQTGLPRRHGLLRSKRGSTLAAALALAFLIFAVTTASLLRVASSHAQITLRHHQASALYLAEAGIAQAAARLAVNPAYSGETGTRLSTGAFDVSVRPAGGRYLVTSIGYAASPLNKKPKKTVQAVLRVGGGSIVVTDWKEDL